MNQGFEIKNLGEAKSFIRIQIVCDPKNGVMKLHQTSYVENMLEKFKIIDCFSKKMPMETHFIVMKGEEFETDVPYCSLIGILMYLAVSTRPDIAYSVNYLSRFQNVPTQEAWDALKRVLQHLRGTTNYGMKYVTGNFESKIQGYSNSDFGSDLND